ncbi:MAG: hypothetical protein H6Q53_662 [Deltaproteobacteria bacterium]|nr:hypothetical protein [Deltaproteobacteria bacterium]
MSAIPVASAGKKRFYFDVEDVRQVCSIMRCSECLEECMNLMAQGSMECPLCYAMMKVFRKPCVISRAGNHFVQNWHRNTKACAGK